MIVQNLRVIVWPRRLLRTAVRMILRDASDGRGAAHPRLFSLQRGMLVERRVQIVHVSLVMLAVVICIVWASIYGSGASRGQGGRVYLLPFLWVRFFEAWSISSGV